MFFTDYNRYEQALMQQGADRDRVLAEYEQIKQRNPEHRYPKTLGRFYAIQLGFPIKILIDVLDQITEYAILQGKVVLSIGLGIGLLEERMRLRGCRIEGLEPILGSGCPFETSQENLVFQGLVRRVAWFDPQNRQEVIQLKNRIQTCFSALMCAYHKKDLADVIVLMIMPPPASSGAHQPYGNGMAFYLEVFAALRGRLFAGFYDIAGRASTLEPVERMPVRALEPGVSLVQTCIPMGGVNYGLQVSASLLSTWRYETMCPILQRAGLKALFAESDTEPTSSEEVSTQSEESHSESRSMVSEDESFQGCTVTSDDRWTTDYEQESIYEDAETHTAYGPGL